MATLLDSFLVTLDSKADTSGFDLFGAASRRLVITLGDVMNIIGRVTGGIADVFNNVVKADVINAKIDGLSTKVGESSQYIRKQVYEMSQSLGTDFASAIDNYAKLKQYGIDPLDGSLKNLKGIGMVYGSDMNRLILAYGQIAAMGSLQGQEKNQLINAGVPIWQMLQRSTGKTVGQLQDMMRGKQITFDMVSKAFADEDKRLQPSIEKLSHSVNAQIVKMKNWWFNAQQTVANTRLWDKASKFLEGWVDKFIGYFTDERILNGLNDIGDWIINLVQNIIELYHAVTSNFPAMLAIIVYVLNSIAKTWGATMLSMAKSGVLLLLNPVTWIVVALGLLLLALIDIDDAVQGKKSFINWGEGIKTAYKWFKDFTIGVSDWLMDGATWEDLGKKLKGIFDVVAGYFTSAMAKVQAAISALKPPTWVKSILSMFGMDITDPDAPKTTSSGDPDIDAFNARENAYNADRFKNAPKQQPPQDQGRSWSDILLDPYFVANNMVNSWMMPAVTRGRAAQAAGRDGIGGMTTNNVTVTSTINTPADPKAIAGAVGTEVVNGVNKATGQNATVESNNKGATKQ